MFLEISHKIHKENTCVRVSFSNFIKKETLALVIDFPPKFLRTAFSENTSSIFLAVFATAAATLSHLPFSSLQLGIGTLYSVSLLYNFTISSLLFLLPKTEFVSSFAFVLRSLFLPAERC